MSSVSIKRATSRANRIDDQRATGNDNSRIGMSVSGSRVIES